MVSSLHSSVLGNVVPMGNVSAVSSSSSATTTTSSYTGSYDSASFSSTGKMMAAEGSHPPDFDSMSTDEFRDHLVELQEKMAADGIDISGFTDPTTMSDDDLNALKDEMASMGKGGPQGKNGPPPPPPSSSTSVEESYGTDESETLEKLIEILEKAEEEAEESIVQTMFNALV